LVDNFFNLRYFPLEIFTGKKNMAIDDFLAKNMSEFDTPILRFYDWQPKCISLGFHQKESSFNLEKLASDNVDIIRRPTGGRAVFHANEITYSLIFPLKRINKDELYHKSHLAFVTSVSLLMSGIDFAKSNSNFKELNKHKDGINCFNSSAKFEVQKLGKKIIGSAQRLYSNAILQHGSILLGPEHSNILNYINASEQEKLKMMGTINKHTDYIDLNNLQKSKTELLDLFVNELKNVFKINHILQESNKECFINI
jgi:lipoate-protein ligase A